MGSYLEVTCSSQGTNFSLAGTLNILPTMDKLKSKRVVLDSKCHMCGCLEETMMHALVGCGWAQGVWKITKFRELIVHNRHHNLWGLFQYARNVVTNF